jgi:hypothetical protein
MLAMALTGNTFAQVLPVTDIWLARIENGVPSKPVKISEGNGYNNQPRFDHISRLTIHLKNDQIALVSD